MANRVVAYVDGFNLYFGLKSDRGRKHLWLDLQAKTIAAKCAVWKDDSRNGHGVAVPAARGGSDMKRKKRM